MSFDPRTVIDTLNDPDHIAEQVPMQIGDQYFMPAAALSFECLLDSEGREAGVFTMTLPDRPIGLSARVTPASMRVIACELLKAARRFEAAAAFAAGGAIRRAKK